MPNTRDKPLVVQVSPEAGSLDAVWWAADYASRRGSPLLLVHTSPDILSIVEQVRRRYPEVALHQEFATGSAVDILVAESATAHLVVVGRRPRRVFAKATATELSARARCPVVAVPPGLRWYDPELPVVVGVHNGDSAPDLLAVAFTEAEALGTGVTVVRCGPRSDDVERSISAAATRHPGVPLHTEMIGGSPARALAWHAHFGSMVVVGSHGAGPSVSRAVMRRTSIPVVVVGPHAVLPATSDTGEEPARRAENLTSSPVAARIDEPV
jgi:nucleotide-binding universal stress UspA family protein